MFVKHAFVLAAIGVAVGLACALGVTQLMSTLLYNIPRSTHLWVGADCVDRRGTRRQLPAGAASDAGRARRGAPHGLIPLAPRSENGAHQCQRDGHVAAVHQYVRPGAALE